MDRGTWWDNTDVLVVADPAQRRLLWVPRDLWCPALGDRVNRGYALGGSDGLLAALAEHGLTAEHTLIAKRDAVAALIDRLAVTVPVEREESFWYPLDPQRPIEEGRRQIDFSPPSERLEGERLHAWIGARYRVEGIATDLDRIERQQRLLAVLMMKGTDFSPLLEGDGCRVSSGDAVAELRQVAPGWRLETFGPLAPAEIEGRHVLVPASP